MNYTIIRTNQIKPVQNYINEIEMTLNRVVGGWWLLVMLQSDII